MSSQKPVAKGQRTISSFFAPKSSQKPSNAPTGPLAAANAKLRDAPKTTGKEKKLPVITRKKVADDVDKEGNRQENGREQDIEEEDEELAPSTSKSRRRPSKRTIADIEGDDDGDDEDGDYNDTAAGKNTEDDDDDLYSVPNPKKKLKTTPNTEIKTQKPPNRPLQSQTAAIYSYNCNQLAESTPATEDDFETLERKARLREQFRKKLGRIDIARNPGDMLDVNEPSNDPNEDDTPIGDDEPPTGAITARFGNGTKKAPKGGARKSGKLTPLDKQVVDIKKKYPDTILIVEVGYKFRFFGEDAKIASENLSIVCIPGKMRFDNHPSEAHYDKFASASIPVHRLHVHVRRLVSNGYKVGVVRQLETAALKAAGDNRNAPFERRLTNLYTKGTYIDDVDGLDGTDLSSGAGNGGAPNTGFILCLTEKPGGGTGTDEKAHVGMVAVQPSTGEVVYDQFDDGFMRSEIETRLLHIAPCEFLIVGELTKATEKLVSHLAGNTTTVLGGKTRIERVGKQKESEAEAATHITKFYANQVQASKSRDEATDKNSLLDAVTELPTLVTLCLSALIKHLSDYGLEHVLDLTKYFQPFSTRSHMLLNGNTLSSLEIYRNQTDHTSKGSLFWTLDKTKTRFGKRLLRNWVGRPLLDQHQLQERINAVEEMREGGDPKLEKLKELLSKISYDLEKGLIRIYYGKCTRPELLAILQAMNRVAFAFQPVDEPEQVGFKSALLNSCIASLPRIRDDVAGFLDVFSHPAAAKDDKYDFFKGSDDEEYEAINEQKLGIAAVEADLEEHKTEIASVLKLKKPIYVTVSGIEYLVEVPNDKTSLSRVPASWIKISGTKKLSRFHTPTVIRLLRERDQHKESLSLCCDQAFSRFLSRISTFYQPLRDTVYSLATLDCLLSLAAVSRQPGYSKPTFLHTSATSGIEIDIIDGRHPMVELLLPDTYIPNSTRISSSQGPQSLLITGPNMGGKSSYVRQTALICILAQIGSYVPAASARLSLLDAVFTRMGAFDNMITGESTFMVELSETSDILKSATQRSLVILDELGRGTSTHDGVAIAHAVLDYVVNKIKCACLFVTHYPLLARFEERYKGVVANRHMTFWEDGEERVTFLYKVGEGVAHRSYGLNVARLAGLPGSVLESAREKSRWLEEVLREREMRGWGRRVWEVLRDGDEEKALGLLQRVDELVV
ncbi:mismatch repair MSH3 [Ascodesmis nigricans]|uniref:DNA mismatch repair protein n=1 Tax=Ascodesmis nigricans TaxID=341454 RepID=A0A4V3SJX3_9PEZI|nr:mismatch repair MSH3 [Ascodesmis nigricans]